MALIKCPECNTEVSDKADKCPKCAYPITENEELQDLLEFEKADKKETTDEIRKETVETQPKEKKMLCPKCYSDQLTSDKKGFSAGKAIVGGLLVGPLGLAGGLLGSKKLVIYCVACGHKFKPGEQVTRKPTEKEKEQDEKNFNLQFWPEEYFQFLAM